MPPSLGPSLPPSSRKMKKEGVPGGEERSFFRAGGGGSFEPARKRERGGKLGIYPPAPPLGFHLARLLNIHLLCVWGARAIFSTYPSFFTSGKRGERRSLGEEGINTLCQQGRGGERGRGRKQSDTSCRLCWAPRECVLTQLSTFLCTGPPTILLYEYRRGLLAAYTNTHFFCEGGILRSTRILFSFLRIPPFHTLAVLRAGQKKGENHFLSHWVRPHSSLFIPPPHRWR